MKTKKDRTYSFNHFKKRLKERYNLDITMDEYDQFCNIIISGKKFLINTERQKNDIQTIYDIPAAGILIRVVWSQGKQLLTTVLPIRQHHVWCNFPHTNPDTCKMCDRFYRDYPIEGLTPDKLLKKHFPDVIKKGE
jgi:hypothetical protein